ncbi:MAG: GAF domain-containing protein [Anaerolineales bacterium]|jgi:GAF domain-containing protein
MKSSKNLTPEQQKSQAYNIQYWRERILKILLIIILVVGIPMYAYNVPTFIEIHDWLFLSVSTLGLLYGVIITFLGEKISYRVRAISVITISYLFSILSFQNYGLSGDARIWLLFFVVFSTIMLGLPTGLIASGISAITYVTAGYLIVNNIFVPQVSIAISYSAEPLSWITAGFTLLFASLMLSISTGIFIQGLEKSLVDLSDSFETSQILGMELEQEHGRLAERSQDLERRVTQIRTAADISRLLGTILDSQELLQNAADLIRDRFDLYYIGIFLVDDNRRYAVLTAGTGDPGKQMLQEEHKLSIGGTSMVGWTTAQGKPRIALDVGQEAVRFVNPHLPLTRSEMALPIAIGNQILGAISVQSVEAEAFDQNDIVVLQGIADSLAVALENAKLFNQFEESLKEIQNLNRLYFSEAWSGVIGKTEKEITVSKEFDSSITGEFEELNIPLVLRGDQIIGNITIETDRSELHPEEKEFIDAISTQAAMALESARLFQEAQTRVGSERIISEVSAEMRETLDIRTIMMTAADKVRSMMNLPEVTIRLAEPSEYESYYSDDFEEDNSD